MTAAEVLAVLDDLEAHGVLAWVDGGWGVDALLGEQTRDHDDLDLVIDRQALDAAREQFLDAGFALERDWLPTTIALRHPDGRAVDLHPVVPTEDGGGDQTLLEGTGTFHYLPPTTGLIGGRRVRCCPVETQVATHLGYEPDEGDVTDMRRLAAACDLTLPPPYADPTASSPTW